MKKEKIKRKYVFIGLILLVLIIIFGVTVSYFRSDFTSKNEIIGTGNLVIMSDTFVSPSNWMPGDELTTDFTISNPSNMSVSLRAKVEEKWNNSNLHNKLDNGEDVVLKTVGSNWVEYNGYYYYQNTLANHNSVSTTLFSKLTFNPKVEAGVNCTTVDDVRECSSNGTYTNSKYELKITYEFIDSSIATDDWNYTTTINPYIKAVYTYNEGVCEENDFSGKFGGTDTNCEYSTCIITGECPKGTIIDYQVDSDTTDNTLNMAGSTGILRFHVLYDSNNILILQMNKNLQSLNGTAWYITTYDATKGPATILPLLETATNGWINVNPQTYTLGTDFFGTGEFRTNQVGCDKFSCNENTYNLETIDATLGGLTRTQVKARLLTRQEAVQNGCVVFEMGTCPKYMINYLNYNSDGKTTFYPSGSAANYGYWTSSARSDFHGNAWLVNWAGNIHNAGTDDNLRGVRPVVVVNKFE